MMKQTKTFIYVSGACGSHRMKNSIHADYPSVRIDSHTFNFGKLNLKKGDKIKITLEKVET